jgi:outer membrane lipoprotein-sorting protein
MRAAVSTAGLIGLVLLPLVGASGALAVPLPRPRPKVVAAAPATTQSIPAPPAALRMTQQQLLDRVNLYLSRVQSLTGKFTQIGPDGRRTEGDFYIQKPGRLRFAYHPPSTLDVIADGNTLAVRDRREATQQVYPLSQTPLRFLLSDRVDLANDTRLLAISADKNFVSVTIEESQPFVGTHRMLLMFDANDFRLRQWTVTDPQGLHTTVAVYDLDPSKKPDPRLFMIQ